jgi:hypothetical protein
MRRMWSELFQSRLDEHQATRSAHQADASVALHTAITEHEEGLKTGEYALRKHQTMIARAEYFERQNKKKKAAPAAKETINVSGEELMANIEEHENKKPWSRLRVMVKKAKIRDFFREQGWAEPAEEWLFDVTNKKLPAVVITYDTQTAKIVSIKGMNIKE